MEMEVESRVMDRQRCMQRDHSSGGSKKRNQRGGERRGEGKRAHVGTTKKTEAGRATGEITRDSRREKKEPFDQRAHIRH